MNCEEVAAPVTIIWRMIGEPNNWIKEPQKGERDLHVIRIPFCMHIGAATLLNEEEEEPTCECKDSTKMEHEADLCEVRIASHSD
jgi:hypothetical protein